MRLPADLLERPPEESARLLALSFLKEATEARVRLNDPGDTEALHDFRVAVRRLRSCVRAFRPQLHSSVSGKLRRRLRDLTTATNSARDAEVLLALVTNEAPAAVGADHNGTEWLVQRLENRRVEAQQRIAGEAIAPFDALEPRLRKRLGRYQAVVHLDRRAPRSGFGRLAGKLIRGQVGDLREQLATVEGPHDADVAHRARITAKRLRYLLEPLVRRSKRVKVMVSSLKDLQDLLGEIRDTQVLQAEIGSGAVVVPPAASSDPEIVGSLPEVPDLSSVSAVAKSRLDHLFARLQSEWLEGKAEPLLDRIERFGAGLESRRTRNVEIERKFLLTGLPEIVKEIVPLEIDQGWIAGELVDERVRRTRTPKGSLYSRTIKLGAGVTRSEFEESMTPDAFETMWPLTVNRRVSKRRYPVPQGDRTWEIDEFTDRELVLAEIELWTEDEELVIPGWLEPYIVREVTNEPEYVNVNLAK